MVFSINITDTSGNTGTVIADGGFSYTDRLSSINESNLVFSGSGELKRSLIGPGSIVKIYRNETLEFQGLVDDIEYYKGGGMNVHASGYEVWLAKENGDYVGSPWSSTASATIFSAVIGESSYFSAGTVNAGTNIDFRAEVTDSLWNILSNLKSKTGQDIGIDYPNLEIDILNHKGSSSSVETLNAGIQIGDVRVSKGYPQGNDVRIYGKGDGDNQIKSDPSSYGQDAASQASYGTIRYVIVDRTITSEAEANLLADAEVARLADPVKVYEFDVLNPAKDWVSGDVLTINAPSQEVSNETVRIVEVKRGVRNNSEFLELEVTNEEYSEKLKSKDEIIAQLQKDSRDKTYMDGTTNVLTFSEQINANSTYPLRVIAYLPSNFISDEVGNLRVNSFTFDYDVDPYRRSVGIASESNVAPDVAGTSDSTQPGVSGSSDSTQPGVSGNSGDFSSYSSVGSDSVSTTACTNAVWNQCASVRPGSSYTNQTLLANLYLYGESGGPEDIEVRIGNDNIYGYIEPGVAGSGATVWGTYCDGFRDTSMIVFTQIPVGSVGSSTDDIFVEVRPQSGAISLDVGLFIYTLEHDHDDGSYYANSHTHADGSYYANNHDHDDGSYGAASHNHSVSVGDDVSDSGSINASQVSLYLDYWNGSSWVNKHSILNTGKTLDSDVDISNSGTYPDAAGYWRVRVYTDNATPDLVQGIIKCKHELDT